MPLPGCSIRDRKWGATEGQVDCSDGGGGWHCPSVWGTYPGKKQRAKLDETIFGLFIYTVLIYKYMFIKLRSRAFEIEIWLGIRLAHLE